VLRRVRNVLVRKAGHEVVAVVVVRLETDVNALVTRLLCCRDEVFGEKLALFVEIVAGALLSCH
jgi:hypothetical protein